MEQVEQMEPVQQAASDGVVMKRVERPREVSTTDRVATTRARQEELYGEPLRDLVGRCAQTLQLTQAKVSQLLGISAPMLSQLINGHRIKIGNPAAAGRLQSMVQLTSQVASGEIDHATAMAQLQRNAQSTDFLSNQISAVRRTRTLASEIQEVFRRTASAGDFLAAAEILAQSSPEIAELLRVYGTERADRAVRHTEKLLEE